MSTLSIHACWKFPSRVDVGKDQRVNQVRLANYANECDSYLAVFEFEFPNCG